MEGSKENQSPMPIDGSNGGSSNGDRTPCQSGLPYRSIFAVLTLDSVLVYDTHHHHPLSVIQGLHYAGLTDCCWSQDGMNLLVCSSDGYITIVNFSEGELGTVYTPPKTTESVLLPTTTRPAIQEATMPSLPPPVESTPLPPCESGPANVVVAPPPKRAKKMRITPTLVTTVPTAGSPPPTTSTVESVLVTGTATTTAASKRGISDTETETVGAAVTKLTLDGAAAQAEAVSSSPSLKVATTTTTTTETTASGEKPKKKKKRVQPLLISGSN
ncbi:MAG: hypothetical protein SGILL_008988 [Bacillariaceae sp.]